MILYILTTAVLWISIIFVFVQMQKRINYLSSARINLHDALMSEHRYYHRCEGGLGVNDDGSVSHFSIDEGEDYDAARKVRRENS